MSPFASALFRRNYATTTGEIAGRTANEARAEAESLRLDVERLFLITQALWTLLRDQHGYTDEQLIQRVQEIDLQDGKLDGKLAKETARPACPRCGRTLISGRPVCLYCGAESTLDPFKR